nr:MAG TPA: hypothetical protein [Caudoviricetes sp.]DAY11499.1 MAG TPA: hypothetical protein [Caudoviricetes sp.]
MIADMIIQLMDSLEVLTEGLSQQKLNSPTITRELLGLIQPVRSESLNRDIMRLLSI